MTRAVCQSRPLSGLVKSNTGGTVVQLTFLVGESSIAHSVRGHLFGQLVKECFSRLVGRGLDSPALGRPLSGLISRVFCYTQRSCGSVVKREFWRYSWKGLRRQQDRCTTVVSDTSFFVDSEWLARECHTAERGHTRWT